MTIFGSSLVSYNSLFEYLQAEGGIAIDNADIRFASHTSMGGKDVLYGFTINNSPTVQDVWNSTPVWGYPFVGSEVAPGPMATTLVEDGLAKVHGGGTTLDELVRCIPYRQIAAAARRAG